MKQVYRIDSNGLYVESVVLEDNQPTPTDCVNVFPQEGFFKPKWDGTQWIEGLSQSEIDAIKNTPIPLSQLDIIKKTQTDLLFTLMTKGVL